MDSAKKQYEFKFGIAGKTCRLIAAVQRVRPACRLRRACGPGTIWRHRMRIWYDAGGKTYRCIGTLLEYVRKTGERMNQYVLTPAAGKRLIGKAMAAHPAVLSVLQKGTLVILAGTTNSAVVEELFASTGEGAGFSRRKFFRGITLPPGRPTTQAGRWSDDNEFPGDVILTNGQWQKGKTVFDIAGDLKEGDLILKGANALDMAHKRAAILIGHPSAGTIGAALQAVLGRRVRLILPVGLEKRIDGDLDMIAQRVNATGAKGPRLWPVPGEVFTEIDAIALLTGARAELIAGGGVWGAEGSVRLAVSGTETVLAKADLLLKTILPEPPFEL